MWMWFSGLSHHVFWQVAIGFSEEHSALSSLYKYFQFVATSIILFLSAAVGSA
jgi:hypothetical protein